jgi:hypothetical protein
MSKHRCNRSIYCVPSNGCVGVHRVCVCQLLCGQQRFVHDRNICRMRTQRLDRSGAGVPHCTVRG